MDILSNPMLSNRLRDGVLTALYATVAVVGLVSLGGWFLDIQGLKSIKGEWVTMKTATALSFELCAWCGMATSHCRNRAVGLLGGGMLLVLSGLSAGAYISGGHLALFGLEDSPALSAAPGVPSLGTLLCFTLFATCLISRSYGVQESRWVGRVIIAAGITAHLGYLLDAPLLYYYAPEVSTAMAFHTAFAFECLGLAIVLHPDGTA